MRPTWLLALTAIAVGLAAGGANAQTPRPPFDHDGLAKQVLEGHIRPRYADLAAKAHAFETAIGTACQSRAAADGVAVKAAYRDLLMAWARTEHLRFGPVIDENRFERMSYWPDRQKIGERQVAQLLAKAADSTPPTSEELAKRSVAVQGLTAAEIVLYGKGSDELLADTPQGRFACNYVKAIAGNVSAVAEQIVAGWADGASFARLWMSPGEQNPVYRSRIDTTAEILKAYRAGIYTARDVKLLPSLGLKRIAVRGQLAPKSRPPFELSGLGVAVMIANVEGTRDLYENGGLAAQLAAVEPGVAALVKKQFGDAIDIMRAQEPSVPAVFNEPPAMDKLATAREPLSVAMSEGATTLANLAGLGAMVLGFSDDDGD